MNLREPKARRKIRSCEDHMLIMVHLCQYVNLACSTYARECDNDLNSHYCNAEINNPVTANTGSQENVVKVKLDAINSR